MRSAVTDAGTLDRLRRLAGRVPIIAWALVGVLAIYGLVAPSILQPNHLLDITRQSAALIIVALGQTMVMIAGGLDLSVGAVITLTDVVAAQQMAGNPAMVVPVVLLCLAIGAGIGLVNGIVVTILRVPALIATLASNSAVLGVALVISGGAPGGSIPANMRFWGNGFIGPIPAATVVWVVVSIVVAVVVTRSAFGRRLLATGANRQAARAGGIRTNRIRIYSYVSSGLLASIGGLILAAYIGTGSLTLGNDYMLNSIAATILGGTPFEGGRGSLVGSILGSLFLLVVFGMLTVLHMAASGQDITQGFVIILAILLYRLREGGGR